MSFRTLSDLDRSIELPLPVRLAQPCVREGRSTKRYEGREKGDELDVASLKDRLKIVALTVGMVAPNLQAKALGVEVGDVIVSYNGEEITTRTELRAQIKAVRESDAEEVVMVLRRGQETVEITLKPGRIGIGSVEKYSEPVFE